MISIVGLGTAASRIADKFIHTKNYNVYQLNSGVARKTKYKYKLKEYESPEDYEKNIPDLKKFFAEIGDTIQFIIVGSSFRDRKSVV